MQDHLKYRWAQYGRLRSAIAEHEGSLLKFAEGYKHFGIQEEGNEQVYREWAPAAVKAWLIGDFNNVRCALRQTRLHLKQFCFTLHFVLRYIVICIL